MKLTVSVASCTLLLCEQTLICTTLQFSNERLRTIFMFQGLSTARIRCQLWHASDIIRDYPQNAAERKKSRGLASLLCGPHLTPTMFNPFLARTMEIAMLIIILVLATLYFRSLFCRQRNASLQAFPPGPPGWPILGSLLEIPQTDPWATFRDWSTRYSQYDYLLIRRSLNVIYRLGRDTPQDPWSPSDSTQYSRSNVGSF